MNMHLAVCGGDIEKARTVPGWTAGEYYTAIVQLNTKIDEMEKAKKRKPPAG